MYWVELERHWIRKLVNEALAVIPGTWIYWPELPVATKLSDWLGKF